MKTKKYVGKYGCGEEKSVSLFYASGVSKDGFNPRCIDCEKRYYKIKADRKKNKPQIPDGMKQCVGSTGCGEIKKLEEFAIRDGKHRNQCKKCQNKIKAKWALDNSEYVKEKQREYVRKNPSKIKAKYDRWKKKHPEYFEQPYVKLATGLRSRLYAAIRKKCKTGSAVRDLGCSIEELKIYLEKQFYPNKETGEIMSWENYGYYGWHIDHIMPLISFNLEDREEFLKACHYTNLQPLWAKENFKKGSKI